MKHLLNLGIPILLTIANMANGQEKFNKKTDLFIAQFDNLPDNDDVHSQAALGSILSHPNFEDINYFCAAGAWGNQWNNRQSSKWTYVNSNPLFDLAFGKQAKSTDSDDALKIAKWVDAHGPTDSKERTDNLNFAAEVIKDKAKPILTSGGKVWVMEAGQSDLTADWIAMLIADGVTNTKTNVIIVQHSIWNEKMTTPADLDFVKENTHYVQLDDGNSPYGKGRDRGDETPNYKDESSDFIIEAVSDSNPNAHTRSLWKKAQELAATTNYKGPISKGGVDFSDTVEGMWILGLADESAELTTVQDFWDKFVINQTAEKH
ncbi:hypothetical protein [Rubritalea sp.]|uniref:hypothetical protein n=1 Tax=Rubritalea sp. TaxID=2109375 RepID=UPI003EF29601